MNSFLLTISGVLFLLTCGLSAPTCPIQIGIVGTLKKMECNDNVRLFVPSREHTNFSAAAMCFLNQFETMKTCPPPSMVNNVKNTLKIMVREDATCIFETREVSYSSFIDEFGRLIQNYNSACASKQK